MRTGCIQHPQNAPLMIVHQWQVDSLNGDVTAAQLMSFFEYWHSHKLDEMLKADKPDKRMLIQHHSEPELEAALFVGVARKAIGKAIKTLVDAGIIELTRNPYIPQDRTRHFLFMPEKAQALADQWSEVYQAHFESTKGKRPICIPQNLVGTAIGQSDDCKTPKRRLAQNPTEGTKCQSDDCNKPGGRLAQPVATTKRQSDDCKTPNGVFQNADLTFSNGQMAAFKTPFGVDPKITPEITSETSSEKEDPSPPPKRKSDFEPGSNEPSRQMLNCPKVEQATSPAQQSRSAETPLPRSETNSHVGQEFADFTLGHCLDREKLRHYSFEWGTVDNPLPEFVEHLRANYLPTVEPYKSQGAVTPRAARNYVKKMVLYDEDLLKAEERFDSVMAQWEHCQMLQANPSVASKPISGDLTLRRGFDSQSWRQKRQQRKQQSEVNHA